MAEEQEAPKKKSYVYVVPRDPGTTFADMSQKRTASGKVPVKMVKTPRVMKALKTNHIVAVPEDKAKSLIAKHEEEVKTALVDKQIKPGKDSDHKELEKQNHALQVEREELVKNQKTDEEKEKLENYDKLESEKLQAEVDKENAESELKDAKEEVAQLKKDLKEAKKANK